MIYRHILTDSDTIKARAARHDRYCDKLADTVLALEHADRKQYPAADIIARAYTRKLNAAEKNGERLAALLADCAAAGL